MERFNSPSMRWAVWFSKELNKFDLILLIEFADTLIISFYNFYGPEWLCWQNLLIAGITFPGSAIMLFIKGSTGQSAYLQSHVLSV